MASHSPPFYKAVSSSSHRTLETTAQDSSHRIITSLLEGQNRSAGLDESQKARPCDMSQTTTQNLVSEQHGDQPSGSIRRRQSGKTTVLPEPLPSMSIDPLPLDLSEPQQGQVQTQVQGRLGGAGQSRTNLRSTLGDRNVSRRGVRSGRGSRGPPVRGNDKGRSLPEVRPNVLETSCTLFVSNLVYPYLTQLEARFPA